MKIKPITPLSRRQVLLGMAAMPVAHLLGCGTVESRDPLAGVPDSGQDAGGGAGQDFGTTSSADGGTGGDEDLGGEAGEDAGNNVADAGQSGWATGGTAAMVNPDGYPDPFSALGATCAISCLTTIGPCHTTSPLRRDVSDGLDGLPVRLKLRVVDEDCEPVEDAIVEIWHTNPQGTYSGDIASICNSTEEERAAQYFRGYQRSDADGRVDFDTCFPGWYPGRAVHIHFRVQLGPYDPADNAASEVISQLFFADTLNDEIFATQPVYSDFGAPDTTNTTDGIVGDVNDLSDYICDVTRMDDGAMLASATIVLRTASGPCSL